MHAAKTTRLTRRGVPTAAAPVALRFPCSSAQRRFWVLDQMNPGTPSLNIAVRWRLEGEVSTSELESAFARIIDRHQPLRTYIVEEDGAPMQVVEPLVSLRIPEVDLTGLSHHAALAEADQIAQLEARTPFDLAVAPLIRVTRVCVSAKVSIILVTVHHLVCDGWSIGVIAREMGTICAALRAGTEPMLPALPTTYGEYSALQDQGAAKEARQRDEAFWKHSLQDVEHFELLPDRPRPLVQTSSGRIVSLLLERAVTERMAELSRRSGCTLYMTSLAALFTLLHRYSGATDIAIGSQVSGRERDDVEDAVGLFINTVMRRCDLAGDPTFAALLARVRDTVIDSIDHLGTPLDRVIELLKPARDLSRNALFSVNFIFQRSFVAGAAYGSFELIDLPSCSAGAMYDLNFFMVERPDGWRVSCEYNTDLFEPETVQRLLEHFANLLRAAVADPAQALSAMPMLDLAERTALIVDWNRTDADYPGHLTLPQLFKLQVDDTPGAIAVVCAERRLSYREVDLASNRLARDLQMRGIGRGSRVGVCLERSPDLVMALLAVLKSGAAYVPLDPAYPMARLTQIVDDAQPAAVLTTPAQRAHVPNAAMVILLDSISSHSDSPLDTNPSPDDVAYVIYTSGSTGRPKGVQIRHRALTNLLWSMRTTPGIGRDDTLISVTTVSFDMSVPDLFLPLVTGAKLVLAREEEMADGGALLRLLRRHGATIMQGTPVTWQILLAAGWSAADRPLKMLCGGEAMSRQLADQLLPRGELWNMYGPTETTVWSSAQRVAPGSGPVLIGPPLANTQFYVLDRDGGLMPTGAPGELYIGGDGVALGYLNLAELSAERFVADHVRDIEGARLYRTGDRVRARPGGTIEFLGRGDQQIKLRGFRIELGEIESILRAHAEVADCVVIAGPDASGESSIRAYVVAAADASTDLVAALQANLRKALPAYMCPSSISVVAALPRTPNGKLDRARLPRVAAVLDRAGAAKPPTGDGAIRLAKLWSAVLGIPAVDVDANFFEIGGHSLLAMRLLVRIQAEFGKRLSLAALFQNPTIAGQARLLSEMGAESDPRAFDFRQVVKLQSSGHKAPLIAINNTGIYYALSKHLGSDQPFTSLQLFDPLLPQSSLPRTLEEIASGYAVLIRRVQPRGPYALLGWCVAGVLAFEVARQLTAGGGKVAQLILFDTWVPGHLRRLPWLRARLADYAYRWHLIAADWAKVRSGHRSLRSFIASRTIVKKLMRWLVPGWQPEHRELATPGQPLSPEQYDQWLLQYLENVTESYEPKPYAGRMTLFRSSEEPAGWFLDGAMGWGAFVAGGIDLAVIDGDHFSIFREPSVSALASRVAAATSAVSAVPALSVR